MSTVKPKASHTIGNIASCVTLLNGLLFVLLILAQEQQWVDVISPAFLEDGFCVANKEYSVYVQSHALCFYVDTAFALFLWILCKTSESRYSSEALEPIWKAILPTFGHGCGHLSLAILGTGTTETPLEKSDSLVILARSSLILVLFWYAFMRSIVGVEKGHTLSLVLTVVYTSIHVFLVPGRFGFTYVQTMLILTYTLHALSKKEKSTYYNAISVIIGLPVGFVAWFEVFACEQFYVHIGGHVWYDLTIPLSYCAYYVYVSSIEKGHVKSE